MAKFSRRRGDLRLLFLLLLLFLGLSFIFSRLIYIQVVEASNLTRLAFKQRTRKIEIVARRGRIIDRSGEELAISLDVESVFATPYLVKDKDMVAHKISPLLGLKEEEVLKKLNRKTGFVYLKRKVDKSQTKKIKELKIEGIGFLKDSKRCYPFKNIASQLIGFVGIDNKGLSGLEFQFDSILRGKPGLMVAETDPRGRLIPGGLIEVSKERNGKSIILTIDKDIQYQCEIELRKAVKKYKAKGGIAIVINPKTGEVYAMANEPTFDLNFFPQAEANLIRNKAVTDTYEPGSTIKTFIGAAAIEEKIFNPDSIIHLPGKLKVGKEIIEEAHPRPCGDYKFTEIIAHSYNIGAVMIGLRLGENRVYNYLKSFGFGVKTDIDFPGEASGALPNPSSWSKVSIYNIPFGQGLTVTPIQMIQAVSVIANDGLMVKPYLLSKIIDEGGKVVKEHKLDMGKKVISSATAQEMRYVLEEVVKSGTGKSAAILGYRVAGKTGTAQKPKENGRGYQKGKYIASFVGFVPAQDPQLAILVLIDEPKGVYYGGVVAAPVFKSVGSFALRHLKIPPERREILE